MSKKETYQKKLQAQLDAWNAEIDKLKAKADKAKSDIKLEYYEQIENLKLKQETAKEKLAALRHASDDAWEDLKTGLEGAWLDLGNAVSKASSKFK